MASVAPNSHGGDAGGDPPDRARQLPSQCQGSGLRGETTNQALRKAYRQNEGRPLKIDFEYNDQKTFLPVGAYAKHLNSLIGEVVKKLPLACTWEQIPPTALVHIMPTLEGYFNLREHLTNQTVVEVGKNATETVRRMVNNGLHHQLRKAYRGHKNKIKSKWFDTKEAPEHARREPPPAKSWKRTREEWEQLCDWWADPDQMARAAKNAENRAKNKIKTHQGSKSFARGRHEFMKDNGYFEDLIETWRKTHSCNGVFQNEENENFYNRMKSLQEQVRAGLHRFLTNEEILDAVTESTSRENLAGRGRRLPGTGSSSRVVPNYTFGEGNIVTRDQVTEILKQEAREKELLRKRTEDAELQSNQANLRVSNVEAFLGQFMNHFNSYTQNQNQPGFTPFNIPAPQWFANTNTNLVPNSAPNAPNPVPNSATNPVPNSAPFTLQNSAPLNPGPSTVYTPDPPANVYKYYRTMNPGCQRVPTEDEYVHDDEDNEVDQNGNESGDESDEYDE